MGFHVANTVFFLENGVSFKRDMTAVDMLVTGGTTQEGGLKIVVWVEGNLGLVQ